MRVLWTGRRSNQSVLKEISSGCSLEGMMLKLKLQYFGHLIGRVDSLEKTLDEGYLLTAALPDLQRGIAPLGLLCPGSHGSLDVGLVLPAAAPVLGSRGLEQLLPAAAPDLRRGVAPLHHSCALSASPTQSTVGSVIGATVTLIVISACTVP